MGGFQETFFSHLSDIVCSNGINTEYIIGAHTFNYMVVVLNPDVVTLKDMINGFAYIRHATREEFQMRENVRPNTISKLTTYNTSDPILNLIYVDIICSCVKGVGNVILTFLETVQNTRFQAIVLRGINPAYYYYVKRGYKRSMDLINELPIFKNKTRSFFLEDAHEIKNDLINSELLQDYEDNLKHFDTVRKI